jgi:glutamine amidotransferase
MQLFMSESAEFGQHKGLNLIEGDVVKFNPPATAARRLKVPQVGWNQITARAQGWENSPLAHVKSGERMYFVHSYYVRPRDASIGLSTTAYGEEKFCSSFMKKNIFACQFHPERSGTQGITIYRNVAAWIRDRKN